MIEQLKPYPEYKESGIPWSAELPSTWKTERAKRLFTKMQREVRPEDEVVTCFRDGMVTLRKNRRLRGFTEATAFSGYQGIRKGDLVIHGMDAFAGAIGVSDSDGKGTPVYNVCKPGPGIVAGYYAHTLREMSRSQWILALAKGIRERSTDFRYEMFGNQFVPLPPPAEQAAIVRFLDHWNGRLEKAIRSKRRVIALLQEQKQAIIHRAVTRGLEPNVKLKDSGIPWLGDIPEHWEVRPLKYLSRRIQNGATPPSDSPHYFENGTIPWYGPASINSGIYVGNPSKLINRVALLDGKARLMKAPLLLVVVIGTVGKMALLQEDGATNQQITAFELRTDRILPEFLTLQVKSAEPWLHASASSSTIPILDSGLLKRVAVAAPSIEEQQVVLNFIASATSSLTTAIARYEREITLLREYRTRLTADVVTGKLDVRAAAAQLPEEAEEEPLPDPEIPEEETEGEEVEG